MLSLSVLVLTPHNFWLTEQPEQITEQRVSQWASDLSKAVSIRCTTHQRTGVINLMVTG